MLKIAAEDKNVLFNAISSFAELYLPVDTDGGARFKKWSGGELLSKSLNTVRSAKDFFFPQTENIVDFKVDGKSIEIIDVDNETTDFVLFGVRACDVKSFEVLDRVFLAEPVDTFYKNRREHGIIISCACVKPAETCFCGTFGIDSADPQGDVSCIESDGEMYFEARTERGDELLKRLGDVLNAANESDCETVREKRTELREKYSRLPFAKLSAEAFGAGKTDEYFDSAEWKQLSSSCLGCGTCTFVCPTCQCYDIKDFNTGHGVRRFRCWDSCMYSDFTRMSAGQPRPTQLERFRQRFMHKLVYYPTNNDGLFSCVGCGRCVAKCPINMNIVKVMKTLGKTQCAKEQGHEQD